MIMFHEEDIMKIVAKWVFAFSIILLVYTNTMSAQGVDVEGSKDHPLISRYSGSSIIGYDIRDYDALTLPLGKQASEPSTRKPKFSESKTIEGKVTRLLYVSPEGRSSLEVLRNYQTSLNKAGFETLFTCSQNQCGERMNQALYPLERRLKNSGQISEYALEFPRDQRYLSAKASTDRGDIYVSVYIAVCDINNFRETFNHPVTLLEIVETKPMEGDKVTVTADFIAGEVKGSGHVAIYGIYFDTDKAEVKVDSEPVLGEIGKFLSMNPEIKLYIVGHTDSVGSLSYNLDLSQRRAEAVMNTLVKQYHIAPTRLVAKGVGPLAPIAANLTEEGRTKNRRVELVKQ